MIKFSKFYITVSVHRVQLWDVWWLCVQSSSKMTNTSLSGSDLISPSSRELRVSWGRSGLKLKKSIVNCLRVFTFPSLLLQVSHLPPSGLLLALLLLSLLYWHNCCRATVLVSATIGRGLTGGHSISSICFTIKSSMSLSVSKFILLLLLETYSSCKRFVLLCFFLPRSVSQSWKKKKKKKKFFYFFGFGKFELQKRWKYN